MPHCVGSEVLYSRCVRGAGYGRRLVRKEQGSMDIDPGDVLQEAREAFAKEDYDLALEKYQWFFGNALRIKESYYGVRLSYCLIEWADLGSAYPPALEALTKQKEVSLRAFEENRSCSLFNEYSSICDAMGCSNEPVEAFLEVASSNGELAKKLFTFVYEELARNSQWDLCREYMGNGYKQYKEVLELFDACIDGGNRKGGNQGEGIISSAIAKTVEELLWILEMQAHANADGELESAMKRIKHDFGKRGYAEVFERVSEYAPNQ